MLVDIDVSADVLDLLSWWGVERKQRSVNHIREINLLQDFLAMHL